MWRRILFRAAEVTWPDASVLPGVLWADDKGIRQSEKALRNPGREANIIY